MTAPRVYIAGPFFNPDQVAVIERLEEVLSSYCEVFSPRRDGGILPPNASIEDQNRIFEMNYRAISGCDIMVAQIEALDSRPADLVRAAASRWLDNHVVFSKMPAMVHLGTFVQEVSKELADFVKHKLPNYSDIGTVWEMGVAYELGKPVIAFSSNPHRVMNIMLSCSCRGFVKEYHDVVPAIQRVLNGETVGSHAGEIT